MDDERNNRRMILAAGLCLLVIVLYQNFQRPPVVPVSSQDAGSSGTSTAAKSGDENPAVTSTRAGTSTAVEPVEVTKTRPKIEAKEFVFAGEAGADKKKALPFDVKVTNVGGGIEVFQLHSYRERDADNQATDEPISLANSMEDVEPTKAQYGRMAGIQFGKETTFKVPTEVIYEVVESQRDRVRYRYVTPEKIEIEREYRFRKDAFEIELAVTVRNGSKKKQRHRLQLSAGLALRPAMERGGGLLSGFVPPPDHLDVLCHTGGSVEREHSQSLDKDNEAKEFKESVRWVAIDRQYFVAALVPRDRTEVDCRLSAQDKVAQAALLLPEISLKPGEEKRHKFTAYLGVKKAEFLTLVDADLEGAIDYRILGMNLAPLCTALLWILRLFFGWTQSWGLAILGLTLLVKVILFPLNQRSGKSMRAMAALKPQLEELKAKFPDDRQRQGEETMKLYKEHNVNPAGGCLPILIQMPIWFALYRTLWVSVDLYQQPFLWIADLTTRDPLWILPVTLVVVMFLQQKMTPTTMDPAQQKMMMYTMPLLFGAMMAALPAGLCFYILVNTLLTIVQQHFINRSIGPIGGSASAQGAKS